MVLRQPSLCQIPPFAGKSPGPWVQIHVDNSICKSGCQVGDTHQLPAGGTPKTLNCFVCCIPTPVHLFAQHSIPWMKLDRVFVPILLGLNPEHLNPHQQDKPLKSQSLALLPTAPFGDCAFPSLSFSMTTKISVSPLLRNAF